MQRILNIECKERPRCGAYTHELVIEFMDLDNTMKPNLPEFKYEKREVDSLDYDDKIVPIMMYRADNGFLANFFSYKGPGNGFGGNKFSLEMADGSTEILRGPYSGNYETINAVWPEKPELMSCLLTHRWGYTHVLVSKVQEWMRENPHDFVLCRIQSKNTELRRGTVITPRPSNDAEDFGYNNLIEILL